MLAYLFIAALTFPSGECPQNLITVKEGQAIVLRYNTEPRSDLEKNTVDLKRKKIGTSGDFEDLVFMRNGIFDFNNSRYSFNRDELKFGVVTANISTATLSDSGLYEICIATLNKCQQFNVTVFPHGQGTSSSQNSTNNTTDKEDKSNTPAIVVGSCAAVILIIFIILIVIIFGYRKQIKNRLCPKQQQEDGVMSSVMERLNPPEQNSSRSPDTTTGSITNS